MLRRNGNLLHEFDDVFTFVMSKSTTVNKHETVLLNDCVGRVLAADLLSPTSVPAWRQSAMDGYGFSTTSSLTLLPVNNVAYAGNAMEPMSENEAIHIMTGAVVPDHVDMIVPIEKALIQQTHQGKKLLKPTDISVSRHIKAIGSDVAKNQKVLSKGQLIRPQDQALLASIGVHQISVYEKVRVVILTSGNELVNPGMPLDKGQIYDANAFLLTSLCQQLPITIIAQDRLADDAASIKETLARWQGQVDVIITVGGASVGQKDFMQSCLASWPESWRWKLNMKPGKPFSMAVMQQTTILALPGNPLAAFMTFKTLATPFIQKQAGIKNWQNKSEKRILAGSIQPKSNRLEWCLVVETEQGLQPISNTSSSHLLTLVQANGYIRVNSGQQYQAGDLIDFWKIP